MNPLGNQAEAPKPKRGRGRPRGTKNGPKKASAQAQPLIFKVAHPQSETGTRTGSGDFQETFASIPKPESVTNVTIQPGRPIIYNYNYFWPSSDCGMLGAQPIPVPTQHNLEHRNENVSQESRSLEKISAETQTDQNQRMDRENTAADKREQHPLPLDDMAFVGYREHLFSVGNTVKRSNLEQHILDNNQPSVLDQHQSALNFYYLQVGIQKEVSTAQDADDFNARSGTTDDQQRRPINDGEFIYHLAIKWLHELGTRLGRGSPKHEKVLGELCRLYNAKKLRDDVKESGGSTETVQQAYEKQRINVLGFLRVILKDQSDLLKFMEEYFTCENNYAEVSAKRVGKRPLPMDAKSSPLRKSPIVITLDDEDEEPDRKRFAKDKRPPLIILDEDEYTDQQFTTLEVNEETDLSLTLSDGDQDTDHDLSTLIGDEDANQEMPKVGDEDADLQLTTLDEDEDQSAQYFAVIPNNYYRTWPGEKPSDLPLQLHCQDRWIYELCSTLSPILIKIKSLRNFMYNNFHVTLLRYDKDDCHSDEEETEGTSVAATECDTDDEGMGIKVRGTHSMCPATPLHEKCFGRTTLCNEVLNDQYFTVTHRNKFLGISRSKVEERMDDYEDARVKVDMLLYRAVRTIHVMKKLKAKMSGMSDKDLENFKLGDELGGTSIIHQQTVKLLYSRENEGTIIRGLQNFPVLFVPGVLKILNVREREWSEFRARWNNFISADQIKFMAKYQPSSKEEISI